MDFDVKRIKSVEDKYGNFHNYVVELYGPEKVEVLTIEGLKLLTGCSDEEALKYARKNYAYVQDGVLYFYNREQAEEVQKYVEKFNQ